MWPRLFTVVQGEYEPWHFRFMGAVSAWLLVFINVVILPSQLYVSNTIDLGYEKALLYPYIGASLIILIALVIISSSRSPVIQKLLDGLFFTGVLAVISHSFIPLDWGLLDGDSILRESVNWGLVQVVVWLFLTVCWLYMPSSSFRFGGTLFVAALLVWWLTALVPQILSSNPVDLVVTETKPSQVNPNRSKSEDLQLPNIYHVVLDAYSPNLFADMADKVELTDALRGFTVFPNNLSNYLVTVASGPSYLTGKLYKTGSFKDFQLEARTDGLAGSLHRIGYQIATYTPNKSRFWAHNLASQAVTSKDGTLSTATRFAVISAVRAAPELLRQETEEHVSRLLSDGKSSYSYYKRLSVPLMEQLIADESARSAGGNYIYAHIMIPHPPYVWDGDCSMKEDSDYLLQTECATRLVKRLIQKLQTENRYDESLIIIHSDHGTGLDLGRGSAIAPMSAEVKAKLEASSLYFPPDEIERRFGSLLLIKSPGPSIEGLQVSQKITQLVDIPATVLDLIGKPFGESDGRPIFSDYSERDVSLFTGFYRLEKRKAIVLGRNINRTMIDHFSYSRTRGWRVLPDIEAFHEGW